MIISQVINNNTVFSIDELGNEVVCFGKGIGFNHKKGQSLEKGEVEKVFVLKDENEKSNFSAMVDEIPFEIIQFGIRASDYIQDCCSKKINKRHLLIPLVDHIYTTLERYKEGITLESNVLWNIQFLYREEYKIAQDICDMLVSHSGVIIDDSEAYYITLHIVNSELDLDSKDGYKATNIIETAYKTVEETFDVVLNKEDIAFQRFVTHLQFLAKRVITKTFITEDNDMNDFIKYKYADAYKCAINIVNRINNEYTVKINDSEISFLTIHIARLIKNFNEK